MQFQNVNTHTRPTHTHTTHDKQTESGDDATSERETEAHRVRGGWRLEHHPGKGLDILKADTEHPTPPHSQLNPPAGGNGGRTHATLSSPRGTKAWDLCKPRATGPTAAQRTHTHTHTHMHAGEVKV